MRIFITGITGSLGRTVLKKLLEETEHAIIGYSRDEQKQQLLPTHRNFTPIIGDIRDRGALCRAVSSSDIIMHFAALKCVDIMERNIHESISTNILGTQNILAEAAAHRIRRVVFTSTDKAVSPINVYGNCKAISEKLVLQDENNTVCRYGNVIGSRGSAIPYFIESLRKTQSVNITDPEMTRFWIHIEEAADFVIKSLHTTGLRIPPMRAAKVTRVTDALAKLLGLNTYQQNIVGVRPGEKLHEQLTETIYSNSPEIQFTDDELMEKLRPIVEELA